MTYSTFCASPSCHLHWLQVRDGLDAVRTRAVVRADTGQLLRESEMRSHTFEVKAFRRVWFQTVDGPRFSLCEDCVRLGFVEVGLSSLPEAVQRTVAAVEMERGAKPTHVAMGRLAYYEEASLCCYAAPGTPEEFMGLEVVRLDQPHGLIVF